MVVKITSSTRPNIEAVCFCNCIVLVQLQMELHAGGNQGGGGDEKQLIDLEWPYSHGSCPQ